MKYVVSFTNKAFKQFTKLPKESRVFIAHKIDYFLEAGNPIKFAKKLQGNSRYYRFRAGDYRLIFSKKDEKTFILLLIVKVAHRKDVYE